MTETIDPIDADEVKRKEPVSGFGYGRTADGQEFLVPATSDLIEHLLDISTPKTLLDAPIIGAIALQIVLFLFKSRIPSFVYVLIFMFWRMCYNVGLGYILKQQSEKRSWERLTTRWGFAEKGKDVDRLPEGRRRVVKTVRSELARHMGSDYEYDSVPHAFNSWLLFRFLVDMILVNDFVAYWIMALVFWDWPGWHWTFLDLVRYVVGIVLVLFNLWVKLDAHRVVKDYAWYWGDFFFLPTTFNLTFDGVFELAPHPMYSVGYIGFYGISLMSKSYVVLFASLFAHACQFAFLTITENPHIDKVYGGGDGPRSGMEREVMRMYFGRDLVVLRNFDFFRSGDLLSWFLGAQACLVALYFRDVKVDGVIIKSALPYLMFQALFWRIFHNYILGYALHRQSETKRWNRHFIKHGDGVRQGFEQWKIIFNASMAMVYISFWLVVWHNYSFPSMQEWIHGPALLRHTIAILLIVLHIWTAASIYEVLGDYGWFYGDFFLPPRGELKYTGIYRFLNNPEKLMGHASFWGGALLAPTPSVFFLALFGHISMWLFLEFVEKPHMLKVYGDQVRNLSGVEKVVRTQVSTTIENTPLVKSVVEKVAPVVEKVVPAVEGVVRRKRGSDDPDSSPNSAPLSRAASFTALAKLTPKQLSMQVSEGLKEMGLMELVEKRMLPPENLDKYQLSSAKDFEFGQEVFVEWEAPEDQWKSTDWIGLYRADTEITDKLTITRSNGCWQYPVISKHFERDGVKMVGGTVKFSQDSLVWDWGEHVARYHYDNKYGVLANCQFNIVLNPVTLPPSAPSFLGPVHRMHAMEKTKVLDELLPIAKRCFGKDDLTPETEFEELWKQSGTIGTSVDLRLEEKQCTRLARAIRRMYGVEFSWRVIARDATLETVAKRVCEARLNQFDE